MSLVEVINIDKTFKALNRREGLAGTFKDLFSRNYSYVTAVNDISMNIEAGEIVGYIGANGAGKSTTIKMMSGLLQPTSGKILVNGIVPYEHREKNNQQIGVVFGQRSQLWWSLPLIESFNILKKIYKISDTDFQSNLDLFSSIVDISGLLNKPIRQMSLGQRTLCDILAAFLHNPKVVFLDEPTIGLDVSIKEKIRVLIKEINKSKNTAILLTSHDISDIETLCNRAIIIDKGKKVFDNSLENLKNIFGSYKTLKLKMDDSKSDNYDFIKTALHNEFPEKDIFEFSSDKDWLSIMVNQEKVVFSDLLSFIIKKYDIKDIQIEDMKIETIVKKIYEGGGFA